MAEKKSIATPKEVKFKIIEVKEISVDGKKFNAFKTIANGGKKMDVRFVRTCKNVPTEPCIIVVAEDMCNVDNTRRYPILWVKDVIRIETYERKSNIADYFDETEVFGETEA